MLAVDQEADWGLLARAADEAATVLGLPANWLNRDCGQYAWCFPLGWRSRTHHVGSFGPLDVHRVSRAGLMAAKVVSGPKRPHDELDVQAMRPSLEELDAIEAHLDRLSSEHLDGFDYAPQRAILQALRDHQ